MIQFDPSNVPLFTASFLNEQLASTPAGMRPNALYLGRKQLDEMDLYLPADVPKAPRQSPFKLRGVDVYPVEAHSHFLMTFVDAPSTKQLLGALLDYCLRLNTAQACPPEFLDIIVLADRVKKSLEKEGI